MKNPNIHHKEHPSLIHVRSTSITNQILIVIAQRKKNFLLTLLNAATDDQVFMWSGRLFHKTLHLYIYIFIHQKMIATKQIRKNEKLDSGHNIENTVTYMPT